MRPNLLRARLKAGEPTLGTHLLSVWPTLVELVGKTGPELVELKKQKVEISRRVVEIKTAIDRIKEQAQNAE